MMVAARDEGCLARGAHHRRRALGAGPARAAARTRRRRPTSATRASPTSSSDFLSLLKLWKLHRRARLRDGRAARISCRTCACASGATCTSSSSRRSRARLDESSVEPDEAGGLSRDPPRAARRAARQRRHARRGRRRSYTGARGIKFWSTRARGPKKPGKWIVGGGAGRDDAAVRAHGRRHRAALAGGDRRPPAQAQPQRAALGEGPRRGGGARARHAVRPAGLRQPARALRAVRPGRGARDLHPRGAGRGRVRHARAVLRPQPAPGRRDRAPRAQVAPPGRPGRRRADPRVLRRAHSQAKSTSLQALRALARGKPKRQSRACCTSRART